MMTMKMFGDKSRFAFGFELLDDPDKDTAAPQDWKESWGRFEIHVLGRNICRYTYMTDVHESCHWYLLPLFSWVADNWQALFHEQRYPTPTRYQDARTAFLSAMGRYLRSESDQQAADEDRWRSWAERHHLRSSAAGGVFPDLFIRRFENEVELSWGNREEPGFPKDFYFISGRHTVRLDLSEVAPPLFDAVTHFASILKKSVTGKSKEWAAIQRGLSEIPEGSQNVRLHWFIYGDTGDGDPSGRIKHLLQALAPADRDLLERDVANENRPLFLNAAPMLAMFGSLSPTFSDDDALKLFTLRASSRRKYSNTPKMEEYTNIYPIYHTGPAYEQGYELALDTLDQFGLNTPDAEQIDIVDLLNELGIDVHHVEFEDNKTRGVALTGDACVPTILVNDTHPMNEKSSGARFTLAHELCHLLHDRDQGTELAHPSGQWAPAGVEQRANAFAAMFLMPEIKLRYMFQHFREKNIERLVSEMASHLDVGFFAITEHLTNLSIIDETDRDALLTGGQHQ